MGHERERSFWRGLRRGRPEAVEPAGPGEESVWDYPRPPRLEPARREVRVVHAGLVVAQSDRALRVCETAGPPVYYVPPQDVRTEWLVPSGSESFCEWKGVARYHTLALPNGERVVDAAWSYPAPDPAFESLRDHLAFYPGRVACFLDDERVTPQPGRFYGGWITHEIKGPFKGEPGTEGW